MNSNKKARTRRAFLEGLQQGKLHRANRTGAGDRQTVVGREGPVIGGLELAVTVDCVIWEA